MHYDQFVERVSGNIVPLPSQFHDDFTINFDGYRRHVDFLLEHGVKSIYLALSASEFEYMTLEERLKVTELVVKKVDGRALVLAQPVGGGCVEAYVNEGQAMFDAGAEILVVKPMALKEDQKFFSTFYRRRGYAANRKNIEDVFVDLFEEIARKTQAPLIFHDKPFHSFELIRRILEIDNVVGYKSHEMMPWIRQEIYKTWGKDYICFDGLGRTEQLWSLLWGARARHTCWSWFDPKRDTDFLEYVTNGQLLEATRLVNEEWGFVNAILETGFHGYKTAMELMGLPAGPVRQPGVCIGVEGKALVRDAMKSMGYELRNSI